MTVFSKTPLANLIYAHRIANKCLASVNALLGTRNALQSSPKNPPADVCELAQRSAAQLQALRSAWQSLGHETTAHFVPENWHRRLVALAGTIVLCIQQSNEQILPHDGRTFCRLPIERWPATVAAVTGIVSVFDSANVQMELLNEFQTAVRSLFDAAVTQASARKEAARTQAHIALQPHATEQQRATARSAKQEFFDALDYAVQIATFSTNQSVNALVAMLVNDYEELAQIEL